MSISRVVAVVLVLGFAFFAPLTTAAPARALPFEASSAALSQAFATKGLLHDPRLLSYRSPFGAVPAGTAVTLRLRTAHNGASSVALYSVQTTSHAAAHRSLTLETRGKKYDVWRVAFIPRDVAIYAYDFLVKKGKNKRWYGDTAAAENTAGSVYTGTPDQQFHLTSYAPTFHTPAWSRDAVYYQIFPDSFYNGDPTNDRKVMAAVGGAPEPTFYTSESAAPVGQYGFYGGDLQGIDDKLGYLKDLGVNTLYLNPIFLASTNHKYDTSDYFTIDPHFGTMQTLQTLLSDAHADGMRVILDGVFNHTGNNSIYFNQYNQFPEVGAYQSQNSRYYPWYTFTSWPDSVVTFPNASNLPQLSESDPVKDFIFRNPDSVAQHWLSAGADGWRLDAATYKSHAWWQSFRASVKAKFPEDVMICECDLSPIDATPYLLGNEFDGDMNYRFRDLILQFFARGGDSQSSFPASSTSFFNQLLSEVQEYPLPALMASMNLVDSHDTGRILTSLGGSKAELKQVITFQATWLGAPAIYYGDEAGMANAPSPDPFYVSRQFYDWQHPDTNMQSYYRSVLHVRQANPALRDGTITPLVLNNNNRIVSFLRHDSSQSVVVAFNDDAKEHSVKLKLPNVRDGTLLSDALSGTDYTVTKDAITVHLQPTSAVILAQVPATARRVRS